MGLHEDGREQRKSVRRPVPESRQRCEVKVRGEMLPAWLLDESAEGFAVLVNRLGAEIANERIELRTDGMCFDVRVAHITEVIPRIFVSGKGPWFRLGLRCLNELDIASPSDGSSRTKIAHSSVAMAWNWLVNHALLTVAAATLSVGSAVTYWLLR